MFRYLLTGAFCCLYLAYITIFGIRLHSWDDDSGVCYRTNFKTTSNHPLDDEVYLGVTTSFFLLGMICSCRAPSDNLVRRMDQHIPNSKHKDLMINVISMILTGTFPKSWLCQQLRSQHVSAGPSLEAGRKHDPTDSSWTKSWIAWSWKRLSDPGSRDIQDWASNNPLFVLFLTLYPCPVHGYFVFAIRSSNQSYLTGESEDQWGFGQIVPLVLLMSVISDCLGVFFRESRTSARRSSSS